MMTTEVKPKLANTPQAGINDFWSKFATKKASKVTSIFPRLLYASILPEQPDPRGIASVRNAADSYEAAAKECREKVGKIVQECYRTNEKFTDGDFDIESDFDGRRNCLNGLEYIDDEAGGRSRSPSPRVRQGDAADLGGTMRKRGVEMREHYCPYSVHRLEWIFQNPKFTIDGFSSSDIHQGSNGDCWWIAAVATIAHRKDLMEKVCVIQNEECGVYGFVFHRDGGWVPTVVDDNLYLKSLDFREAFYGSYDPTGEKAKKYRAQEQTGSEALYFAHCEDPNETWLPLLEKAFAKAHGEYDAISGGWSGEAVEDLTGGVATTIATKRVLSKDKLWKELACGDGDFVFAMSAMGGNGFLSQNSGVVLGHAYSILRATEELDEDGAKLRFVQIRNPWGRRSQDGMGEWNGRWSDGSKEWTPYWMKKLNHTFGDDGVFWMLYEDVLEIFKYIHRTRLFDEKWTIIQQWTSCEVAWLTGYSRTKFVVDVKKAGTIVIVLSQLDDRYFTGLEGQYKYELHFLLKTQDTPSGDYICRVRPVHEWENRSASAEVYLEPGKYEVLPKITATRDTSTPTMEKLIKQFAERNPQKLRQVGMQYDLAHAKGGITDEDQKIVQRKEMEKEKEKEKLRKKKQQGTTVKVEVEIGIPNPSDSVDVQASDEKKARQEGEGEQFEDAAENLDSGDAQKTIGPVRDVVKRDLEIRPKAPSAFPDKTADEIQAVGGVVQDLTRHGRATGDETREFGKNEKDAEKKEKSENKNDESESEESAESEDDGDDSRWNAVCVTCLRVYSQDSDLTISLVQPETTGGEATSSLVHGQEPAGATQ